MWAEIDTATFAATTEGFHTRPPSRSLGHSGDHAGHGDPKTLYVSAELAGLDAIESLAGSEYGQAIEVDAVNRTIRFGRDYLGHFPLLYTYAGGRVFISDEIGEARAWLQRQGVQPTVSEEALALYFTMGYVPQGMTLFRQIWTCENAHLYRWHDGKISKTRLFKAIEADAGFPVADLRARIEYEVERFYRSSKAVDVWCSGGLDSSIMAYCFNTRGRQADLLTLSYSEEALQARGEGEIPFARDSAAACKARLRYVELSRETYRQVYERFVGQHIGPVIDYVVPPKYALARASRDLAITGEGGDPLFSGVKNNMVLYARQQSPQLRLGWIYAMAHKRFGQRLQDIFIHGSQLRDYVTDYLEGLFDLYPGDVTRKLFYMNTFIKQGGLIFPKNYYAGKRYGVRVRHPLTALPVYEAAFRLPDESKYVYPRGKLALIALYGEELPPSIVTRKKSGTRLYLDQYLRYLIDDGLNLDALYETGMFRDEFLSKQTHDTTEMQTLMIYALHTLNTWLKNNGGSTHERAISAQTRDHQQSVAHL